MGLAKCSKEGYNTSGRYTGINAIKDSPPINIHF